MIYKISVGQRRGGDEVDFYGQREEGTRGSKARRGLASQATLAKLALWLHTSRPRPMQVRARACIGRGRTSGEQLPDRQTENVRDIQTDREKKRDRDRETDRQTESEE